MATTTVRRSNTATLVVGFVVALIIIFLVARYLLREQPPIRVATAHYGDLVSTVSTNGKVEPQTNFEAHAPFPGLIKAVYVHAGDQVTKGELLLTMDNSDAKAKLATAYAGLKGAEADYEIAKAGGTSQNRLQLQGQIAKARIDLSQAKHDLAALKKLELTGAAAPGEIASAQERVQADESSLQVLEQQRSASVNAMAVAHARAGVQEAEQAYAAAQSVVNQSDVRAPFDGTVYSLPVSATEYVDGGSLLLEVANLKHLQVRAYFDEPEIGRLAVGQPITIRWDAKPNELWHGHVTRLPSSIITYGTRNVGEVLVSIDDVDGVLIPNTNVTVTVTVADLKHVLILPRDALHAEQGQSYVYRVVHGKLRQTPVTVGDLNLTDMQIVRGLKAGDVVALGSEATNGQPLSNRLPVTVEQP
jgi:HlyD family secretion protein